MQINNNNIVRTRITYNNIGLVGSILFENNARVAYTYGLNGEKLRVAHWAALASAASANGSVSGGILNPSLPRNIKTTEYIGGGEKLRVIYQTAVPNITVAIGSTRELTAAETLYTDSIDYRLGGALTLRNGRIDKYQFEEGYCQAERNSSTTDNFTFCYYDMDHLGNIRQVTEADSSSTGNVIQRNDYYPFGMQFCDDTASNNVQSRKYNGKEFDNMHGLNTYDYGARQYNPITARWDRIDRFCEKYYNTNPYGYCGNNPITRIDINGDSIIVNRVGTIIRRTNDSDNVYLYEKNNYTQLGSLGGEIKADYIYKNLLDENISKAKKIINPFKFKNNVRDNGIWDLKRNKNTIWGLANDNKTYFAFKGKRMESQDIGNHHFGVVAKAYGFFSEHFILYQAGQNQISNGKSKPEWQRYAYVPSSGFSPSGIPYTMYNRVMLPPYGDDPRDQKWITEGFNYWKKLIK